MGPFGVLLLWLAVPVLIPGVDTTIEVPEVLQAATSEDDWLHVDLVGNGQLQFDFLNGRYDFGLSAPPSRLARAGGRHNVLCPHHPLLATWRHRCGADLLHPAAGSAGISLTAFSDHVKGNVHKLSFTSAHRSMCAIDLLLKYVNTHLVPAVFYSSFFLSLSHSVALCVVRQSRIYSQGICAHPLLRLPGAERRVPRVCG